MNPRITQILLDLALATVPLVLPIVGAALVALLRSHVSRQRLAQALAITDRAVAAVEQIGASQDWTGSRKKIEAVIYVHDLLSRYGLALSNRQASTLIEASVAELKQVHGELSAEMPIVTPGATPPPAITLSTGDTTNTSPPVPPLR